MKRIGISDFTNCLVQLRLVPNHLPDSLPAWNDWARGARKDPAWLSQCTAPTVVNLPQPAPPEISVEVAEDGASLVVLLLWALDARLLPWLQDGPRLRWQYSWRILASSEEEGEQNWRQSGCYHCVPEEETRVRSPPLREDWDCQRVELRVRYSLASVWSSWSFSVSCDVRLPVQEPPMLRIAPSRSNFTEADATWEALVSPAKVKAWQYRIELEQDGKWRLVYAVEHANQAPTVVLSAGGLAMAATHWKTILEASHLWEQVLWMMDPLCIAATSLASKFARSACVAPYSGLLKVPRLMIDYGVFVPPSLELDPLLIAESLPWIEKGEVVEIELYAACDIGEEDNDPASDRQRQNHYNVCIGWLLGSFGKLRRLMIGGGGDRRLWVPVVKNIAKQSPALVSLELQAWPSPNQQTWPEETVKVLPALRKLRRLHLALNSTADPSGTMILDSLASHSSCLQTLQSLSFDVHFAPNTVPEAFRASLQQCLKAYPLRHLSLQAVSPPASDLLSRIVPQMTWPENCCMLSLHHLSNSASLAALAQQVARDAVAGLTLCVLHSDSVTSEQMLQFLSALNLSQLQSLALDFQLYPMLEDADDGLLADRFTQSLCKLASSLKSLKQLTLGKAACTEAGVLAVARSAARSKVCFRTSALLEADTLSCSLRQLVPGQSYTTRLLCRRWRIDDVWQESHQEFRMPLSGVETGVPPLRPVPEVLLAKISPEPRADETQIWYSFWVSPISASWPPESSFVEWRPTCEPDAAWRITPSQKVALKADLEKDETFAHGGGLKVLLPTDIGQLHVRQCHVCGIVGSRTSVMPVFRPPRPPTVQLCPKDTAISLRLCAEILGEDHRHATSVQFQASGAGEAAAGSQELPLLVLDFPEGAASSEHVHLLDVEELVGNVALHQKVVFQVRVGDMATKSAWSPPSAPLALRLASPRPASKDISVKQLERHSVEVSWPRFIAAEGLAEVDYCVKAVCCPMPEDTIQRYLPHAAAAQSSENGGWCRVVLRKLVPELPYIITVTGAYPHLSRFCSQTTAAGASASTGPNGYVYLPRGRLHELLCAEVGYMSTVPIRPLSMQEVLALVSSESLAELIHTDVPKRFAVRIRMIESLQGWETIPEMSELHAMMTRWYRELRLVDPHGGLKQVTEITRAIRQEGSTTAARSHRSYFRCFLLSRIGSNMLLDQYYACAPKAAGGLDRKTGIIQPDCDAVSLCKQAADYASRICQFHTGQRPAVVYDNYEAGTGACQPDSPCYFSYIPGYLRYIMVELLKNSFKATLTSFGPDEIEDAKGRLLKCLRELINQRPGDRPIHVLICRDDTQVLIRVSDRAGGIPSHVGDRIWSYLYGAAAREAVRPGVQDAQTAHSKSTTATPLSGYGVGLPLSRLHARYLGGKLDLTSYPGFGTDISVHLPRITSDQENGEAPEECQLEAHFTLAGVDPLDFPLVFPARQVAPPQLHGGADKRFPFSFQFWLEVDQRSSLRPGSEAEYITEWRPHTTQMDLVPPEKDDEGAWQPVVLEPVGLHAPACGEGLTICTWDLPELPEIPELVQLRLRLLRDDPAAPGVRAWVSQISGPYATAFLPPPKPRVSVSTARHGVQILVMFALRTSSEIDSEEAFRGEVVPGLSLSPGFGHRWARRFQVAHRLAGDRHDKDDLQEFEAKDLQEAEASFDADRPGICWYSITLPAVEPRFSEGQRVVFAVRVGDDCRWSPWSVVSKPTQVRTPPLELREGSEFVVKAKPPDKVEVTLPRLLEDSESVEYSVSMTPLGPKDQKVRNASQLIAFSGFTEALHEGETLETFIGCIDPGTALRFTLMARRQCRGFGAPEFKELAESDILVWPESQPRGSLVPESWDLPVPKPLPVPDEFESSSGRWRGRAVLLTWPKGFAAAEELPLELQVACWDPATGALHGRKGWCASGPYSAAPWSWTEMQGLPCLVASPLPFASCRFRWYSRDRRVAGPVSEPCLAYVDPPVEASAKIFCTISALRLLASFSQPGTADPAVTLCQWRFGAVRQVETDGSPSWSPVEKWQPLPRKPYPRVADTGWSFGEEDDGLELGLFYVFSARLGDGIRYSAWSASSAAVLFDLPESVLPVPAPERFGLPKHLANSEMLVESLGSGSVRCWWPHVQGPVLPSIDGTTQGRPPVEYRLDVSRCLDNGGLERHASVLLEDEEILEEIGDDGEQSRAASHAPCEATVNGLQPGSEYFAALAVRFLVLGRRDWRRTGLTASFQVPGR
eukprot:s15_g8.t1